jgi:hypothetical protein
VPEWCGGEEMVFSLIEEEPLIEKIQRHSGLLIGIFFFVCGWA